MFRLFSPCTSWQAVQCSEPDRTAGTSRGGGCSAGAPLHESAQCFQDQTARAHGEVCPGGRVLGRKADRLRSGTNARAARCWATWRTRQHQLWKHRAHGQVFQRRKLYSMLRLVNVKLVNINFKWVWMGHQIHYQITVTLIEQKYQIRGQKIKNCFQIQKCQILFVQKSVGN